MSSNDVYYNKYLKYKLKYLNLKTKISNLGGADKTKTADMFLKWIKGTPFDPDEWELKNISELGRSRKQNRKIMLIQEQTYKANLIFLDTIIEKLSENDKVKTMKNTIYDNSNPKKLVEYKNISYIGEYHEKINKLKWNQYYADGFGVFKNNDVLYYGTFKYDQERGRSYFVKEATIGITYLTTEKMPHVRHYRKLYVKK